MQTQLSLFENDMKTRSDVKVSRSGTFLDNMALPIHRWFRYSAGFAAQWVEQVLAGWGITKEQIVLDPFAGSGTVSVVCDTMGIPSIGVEAHSLVSRILKAKLLWPTPPQHVVEFASKVLKRAQNERPHTTTFPPLLERSYEPKALASLNALKSSWLSLRDESPESELVWLALTAILRSTSTAGTAQWQYILPNKTKKHIIEPFFAFQQQIRIIKADLRWMQARADRSCADIIAGDARAFAGIVSRKVDAVITSPPYANNYDYADALRLEMTFWGDVNGWGDIHHAVRRHLIVSSSQHSSRERLLLEDLLALEAVAPIRSELAQVVHELAAVRENHGGKKHYHTMIAAYCRDISLTLQQLQRVCKPGSRMCWVIGDSAPYGVYCPIERWIAELAIAAGFKNYSFDKLRDRNIKWKNRKHRVPLKEGLLWIEG
ncbi:MAG: DNA methylase [Syntrophorhabdus sp. PtaU1.Bin058]|nr:MAG: DNA methylase [Syntrophorhabdus sp. PtaU1.Bin058]